MVTATELTMKEVVSRFLNRPNLQPTSLSYYRTLLTNLLWYAHHHRWPTDISLITREHIRSFLDYVSHESYRWPGAQRSSLKKASPATVYHYGKVVKTLFNWAEEEEYIPANPLARLKLGRPRYKEVEPYSDDEIRAMLNVCDDDIQQRYRFLGIRNKAIISLLIDTGLRVSELGGIKLSDLDPKLRQVRVMGKGAKTRVVPTSGEARKALRQYLVDARPKRRGDDLLWQTEDGPMSTRSIKVMIARLKQRAGVNSGGGAHRFRHYFATHYLEGGGDINTLRLLLGHATLAMVLKYSRYVDAKKAFLAHETFSPLDRLYRGDNHNRDDGWGWRY